MFKNNFQINFVAVEYEIYNDNIILYETFKFENMSRNSSIDSFISFIFTIFIIASFFNLINYDFAKLSIESLMRILLKFKIIKFLYEKDFELNKRSFLNSIIILFLI